MAASKKITGQQLPEGVPPPPAGLAPGGEGEKTWLAMHREYIIDGTCPEKLLLLRELVFAVDMVERLRMIVAESESLRTRGSQGQVVEIPEVAAMAKYTTQIIALTRAMQLPEDESSDYDANGKMTRSAAGKKAAAARYGRLKGI